MTAFPVTILKRDGTEVPFDSLKILEAIRKASDATPNHPIPVSQLTVITKNAILKLPADRVPTVELVQDKVEEALVDAGYFHVAKAYILYRAEHSKVRQTEQDLMEIYRELTFSDARDADIKR